MPTQPDPYAEVYHLEWWINGELAGEQLTNQTSDGYRYVCEHPNCGHERPWALKYFPNRALISLYLACPKHEAQRSEIPGSLIAWWGDELERMPDALVQREYAVHLAYYLKEIQNERDTLKAAA